ncbi:MAG: helix-turn-helix domain-containing protein [Planctomycetota bacterium]
MPRFQTEAVRDLYAQLQYTPADTRRRQMEAAESLVAEIEAAALYPHDFVVFRVTGYRPTTGSEVMLVGAALVADLVTLVQRLSETVELRETERHALTLQEVRSRLNVSPKTLQRYRRQGLVCHFLHDAKGVRRLHCFADALDRFLERRASQVRLAATFTRLSEADGRWLVEEARRLRRDEGVSLNEAARRLAPRIGRAHETVRAVLRRHDRRADDPVFAERGPLNEREREFLFRAWRFGVSPARLARRFGKAPPTVHHAINRTRADRLVRLDLQWVSLPTFDLPDSEAVILSSPIVTSGLEDPIDDDVLAMLESARTAGGPTEHVDEVEDALVAAYNLLKRRARVGARRGGDGPALGRDAEAPARGRCVAGGAADRRAEPPSPPARGAGRRDPAARAAGSAGHHGGHRGSGSRPGTAPGTGLCLRDRSRPGAAVRGAPGRTRGGAARARLGAAAATAAAVRPVADVAGPVAPPRGPPRRARRGSAPGDRPPLRMVGESADDARLARGVARGHAGRGRGAAAGGGASSAGGALS